jgi:hypothetical protein
MGERNAVHQTDEGARSSNFARSAQDTKKDTATKPRMSLVECLHLPLGSRRRFGKWPLCAPTAEIPSMLAFAGR